MLVQENQTGTDQNVVTKQKFWHHLLWIPVVLLTTIGVGAAVHILRIRSKKTANRCRSAFLFSKIKDHMYRTI